MVHQRLTQVQTGWFNNHQQLVKNIYLTPAKTLERKFNEVMIAVALEQRLSKQDIFALYCNEIYLGQRMEWVSAGSAGRESILRQR